MNQIDLAELGRCVDVIVEIAKKAGIEHEHLIRLYQTARDLVMIEIKNKLEPEAA